MTAARRAPRGPAGLWVASLVAGTLTSRRHTRLRWLTAGPAARSGPRRGRSRRLPLARTSVRDNAGRGRRAAFVGRIGRCRMRREEVEPVPWCRRCSRCPAHLAAAAPKPRPRPQCRRLLLVLVRAGPDATARHLLTTGIPPTSIEPRHSTLASPRKRITPGRYRLRDVARRSHPPTNRRERHPPRAPPARSATSFHR